jgi:hypothetical protein
MGRWTSFDAFINYKKMQEIMEVKSGTLIIAEYLSFFNPTQLKIHIKQLKLSENVFNRGLEKFYGVKL